MRICGAGFKPQSRPRSGCRISAALQHITARMTKHLRTFPRRGTRAVPATAFLLLSGSAALAETGHASFYGRELAGRRTASGEVFRPDAMTAAHRSLPFGSRVKVTNHTNGKAVVLRITDRGPFVRGRIIDVSHGAARVLGFAGQGTARVTIERMGIDNTAIETPRAAAPAPATARAETDVSPALPEAVLARNPEGKGK